MFVPKITRPRLFLYSAIAISLLAIVIWLISRYISPAPPRVFSMTTGSVDGASHQFGLKYQEYLKNSGVTLNLQTSSGAVQNLERLSAGTPAGFVQGGLGLLSIDPQKNEDDTPLRSLGVVGYEPVWIFTNSVALATSLEQGLAALAGKRVAIGADGSGTRKVALELLQNYGVDENKAQLRPTGGAAATALLENREIDAAIFVAAPQAGFVQKLLNNPSIVLVKISHAEGLTRRLPYLSLVTLKASSVNPQANMPAQDITLLATTANLVVRDDLHPALTYLLLEAAPEVHKKATLLNRPGEFPHPRGTDFPLADEAQRYYKDGRPFLQRYLPFWLANFVQRLLLVLIPLLAVAIPVVKTIPTLLEWREKNRLFKRYELLLQLERNLNSHQMRPDEIHAALKQLDQVELDISEMQFSLDFSDRVYTLRQHVDYVRAQLQKQIPPGDGVNTALAA